MFGYLNPSGKLSCASALICSMLSGMSADFILYTRALLPLASSLLPLLGSTPGMELLREV